MSPSDADEAGGPDFTPVSGVVRPAHADQQRAVTVRRERFSDHARVGNKHRRGQRLPVRLRSSTLDLVDPRVSLGHGASSSSDEAHEFDFPATATATLA
jgi:hypothetical protein